jgi:uncharacterized membrane protein
MTGKRILSFVGLVVTFAAAYGFERLVTHMRTEVGLTASGALAKSTLWVESSALVILAAMLVLLAWYVLSRANRDTWVGAVFVVVGLVLTFLVAIEWSLERVWLSDRVMEFAAYKSYGHYVAAFVAVIGIACLVAPKRRRR